MEGIVFNIQKFCINDGPGIRTNVFLKGCPMNCAWCHNPESKKLQPEIGFQAEKCIGCGACVAVCPNGAHRLKDGEHIFDRTKCTACGACTKACVTEALEQIGEIMTVEAVLEEVLKDEAFYQPSGGGMTLSGGEPTLQFEFAFALLKEAKKRGLHTCIETCGFTTKERIAQLSTVTDLFLYDWKVTDSDTHKGYTNCPNDQILHNLRYLDSLGAASIMRCPIIPGVNDTTEHFMGIASVANTLQHVEAIEIEPYHPFGQDKLARIGEPVVSQSFCMGKSSMPQSFRMPESEEVTEWIRQIQELTAVAVRRA